MLRISPQQEVLRLRVVQSMATQAVKFASNTSGAEGWSVPFSAASLSDPLLPVSRDWRRSVVRSWLSEGILVRAPSLGPRGAYLYVVGMGGVAKLVEIASDKDRAGAYVMVRSEGDGEDFSEGAEEGEALDEERAEISDSPNEAMEGYLKQMVAVLEGFSGRMEKVEQEQGALREDLREALREVRQSPAIVSAPESGPNVVLQSQLVKLRDEMTNIRKLVGDSNELRQLALEVEEKPILKLVERLSGDSDALAGMRSDVQSQIDTLMSFRDGVNKLLANIQARDEGLIFSLNGVAKVSQDIASEHTKSTDRLNDLVGAIKKLSEGVTSLVNGLGTVSKISAHLDEVMDRAEEMEANTVRYAEVVSRYHEIAKFIHESLVMSGIIPHLDGVSLKSKTGASFALIGTPQMQPQIKSTKKGGGG